MKGQMKDIQNTEETVKSDIKTNKNFQSIKEDNVPWFAIRLFTPRQEAVATYFESHNLEIFIPQSFVDFRDKNGQLRHELRPVVQNLIFVKKTIDDCEMRKLVGNSMFKLAVYRKQESPTEYYLIPAKQMYEFRLMCNPELLMRKFLSEEEVKLKEGIRVKVNYGPLKGLTGRLVRQSHKYYLLKEVPGIGVMIKVSRWCCQPLD